jgi:hypothetical protein
MKTADLGRIGKIAFNELVARALAIMSVGEPVIVRRFRRGDGEQEEEDTGGD